MGRTTGRANALTVVLPLRSGGAPALAAWLRILRARPLREFAVGRVDRLRFISAIRWALLPPLDPPGGWPGSRPDEQRRQLLFESNFDGDWDDYLEVFGAVLGRPLSSIIRWGVGFPGLSDADLFKAYAKAHDVEPEHYVSAYPSLTSGDVFQELAAREGAGRVRRRARHGGYGRVHPRWTTILLPLAERRTAAAVRAARALDDPRGPAGDPLLLHTGLVHFARVAVLDRPGGAWLLVSLTHDGSAAEVVTALVAADRQVGPVAADPGERDVTPLRRLFECTRGVPIPSEGWWDDARLVRHLLEARPASTRHQMAYCGYPNRTVADIRALARAPIRHGRWPAQEAPA